MNRYLIYRKNELLSQFLGMTTWMSLSTFMLVAKNAIGIHNIPIFETLIFMAGLIGIKVSYSRILNYASMKFINIVVETVFLLVLYGMLFMNDLVMAGITVYIVIIANAITDKLEDVSRRDYEDYKLSKAEKRYLRRIRKIEEYIITYAGVLGTGVSLVCLTYLKMDLIMYTKIMLVLNVAQNVYDYYIWYKYLRQG